ncbi:MAG: hypothetical protein M3033_12930 [Acidobacteriota bacterium]|nr:hypothetical protein [Acidobacteriota bacterium]
MSEKTNKIFVWVFNGGGNFPSGVFSSKENAEKWINHHKLSGCLTMYPLDEGSYDWAVENNYFSPKRDDQKTSKFIGKFACGEVHYHYGDDSESDE